MPIAIVLLSGGIDSATALYWALKQGFTVKAITYNYPSRPLRELEAVRKLTQYAGVDSIEIELPFLRTAVEIMKENSALFKNITVPEGYIPARNMIFYATAAYYAEIYDVNFIVAGHLETDTIGFPDATPRFFQQIERVINDTKLKQNSISNRIQLLIPFLHQTKDNVLKIGNILKVPFELTWSCYYNGQEPCQKCESCSERAAAFRKAGLLDPLIINEKDN